MIDQHRVIEEDRARLSLASSPFREICHTLHETGEPFILGYFTPYLHRNALPNGQGSGKVPAARPPSFPHWLL